MKGILLYVASVCPFNGSIVIFFWKIHIDVHYGNIDQMDNLQKKCLLYFISHYCVGLNLVCKLIYIDMAL